MIMDNRFIVARRRYDPDATRYINAVQLADGQALEPEVAMAVDTFVRGCKSDGIWDAIKASCLLCGPRTLSGALVPLVGTAPTSYAFASGDYNRVTGLKGDGSTTYLDSNRAENADEKDDRHVAVYQTLTTFSAKYLVGTSASGTRSNLVAVGPIGGTLDVTLSSSANKANAGLYVNGFLGGARDGSTSVTSRGDGITVASSEASATPTSNNYHVFASQGSTAARFNGRLAFYSIGAALSLESLDTRISTYVAAIAAAL